CTHSLSLALCFSLSLSLPFSLSPSLSLSLHSFPSPLCILHKAGHSRATVPPLCHTGMFVPHIALCSLHSYVHVGRCFTRLSLSYSLSLSLPLPLCPRCNN